MADLNFTIQRQEQTQWCWAAVALSICSFYRDTKWKRQCDLVNEVFAPILLGTDCCQEGSSSDCNVPSALDDVLRQAGHLREGLTAPISFATLKNEISSRGSPVAVRIMLADLPGAHFVVLTGCAEVDDGTQFVKVADPSGVAGNTTSLQYSTLIDDYKPGAIWDQSYLTK